MTISLPNQKAQKEQLILNMAEKLFCSKGYENTSMDELAESSGCTKRTLYRYFVSKQDIYFAVLLKGHKRMCSYAKDKSRQSSNGLEKIQSRLKAYRDFYLSSSHFFELMAHVRTVKMEKDPKELPFYHQYVKFLDEMYADVVSLFKDARKDESIREDVDASQLAFVSIFVLSGFFNIFTLAADSCAGHFNLEKEDFLDLTINLMFETILKDRKLALSSEDR